MTPGKPAAPPGASRDEPREATQELSRTLDTASSQALIRIMEYIDRLPSRKNVEDAVSRVRDRLAQVRPPRPLTVKRVLVLPFEDLIVDGGPAAAGASWVVPRQTLSQFHAAILTGLPDKVLRETELMARDRTMDDLAAVHQIGRRVWADAARILRSRAEPTPDRRGTGLPARTAADADAGAGTLSGLALILDHAEEITTALERLPSKPMGMLREHQRATAIGLLRSALAGGGNLFRTCLSILVRRSLHPSDIMTLVVENLPDLTADQRDGALSEVGGECLRDIGRLNDHLESLGPRSLLTTADSVVKVACLLESLAKAPKNARLDARELTTRRQQTANLVLKTYSDGVRGEVRQTFLDMTSRSTDGSTDTGADAETDTEDAGGDDFVSRAEALARSAKRVELVGTRLGLGASLSAVAGAERQLYTDHLRERLATLTFRGAIPTAQVMDQVMDELRVIEILFDSDVAFELMKTLSQPTGRTGGRAGGDQSDYSRNAKGRRGGGSGGGGGEWR